MSLTSYRAAPPRDDVVMNYKGRLWGRPLQFNIVYGFFVSAPRRLQGLAASYSSNA